MTTTELPLAELPECKWRVPHHREGRHGCSSPLLVVSPAGVSAATCAACPVAGREPTGTFLDNQKEHDRGKTKESIARAVAESRARRRRARDEAAGVSRPWCAHRGRMPLEVRTCHTCGLGDIERPVFSCGLHGRCTPAAAYDDVRNCASCGDYRPSPTPEAFPLRDLAYYVCPVSGMGTWQRNIAKLLRYWHLFTGKKVVAIATGGASILCQDDAGRDVHRPLDPPGTVEAMLAGRGVEFIHLTNDPGLREGKAVVPLFQRLESRDPDRCLFFAHAKGVTRPVNDGVTVHPWADILYESLLGYWPAVERTLTERPIAGSFKKVGHGFEGSASTWHYSGSFFWARSADLFSRNWRRVDQVWWGSESWPGIHYRPDEAGVVFHEGRVPSLDLYSMHYLKGTVYPAWERWKVGREGERTVAP